MELSVGILNHPALATHIKSQSCELQRANSQKKRGFCYRPFKEWLFTRHSMMEAVTICIYEHEIVIYQTTVLCYLGWHTCVAANNLFVMVQTHGASGLWVYVCCEIDIYSMMILVTVLAVGYFSIFCCMVLNFMSPVSSGIVYPSLLNFCDSFIHCSWRWHVYFVWCGRYAMQECWQHCFLYKFSYGCTVYEYVTSTWLQWSTVC